MARIIIIMLGDKMNFAFIIELIILIGVFWGDGVTGANDSYQHAVELLSKHPLIDG